jgi:hypothetical protein
MIRIAITRDAFEAIAAALPLGSVGLWGPQLNAKGERLIWLESGVLTVSVLSAMRGAGESYSDVSLRLVG